MKCTIDKSKTNFKWTNGNISFLMIIIYCHSSKTICFAQTIYEILIHSKEQCVTFSRQDAVNKSNNMNWSKTALEYSDSILFTISSTFSSLSEIWVIYYQNILNCFRYRCRYSISIYVKDTKIYKACNISNSITIWF